MSRFRLVREAAEDLSEIFDYIAERDSINAAERVREALLEAMRQLASMPRIGHRRPEITSKGVLFWPVCSFEIIYRPETRPIEIVAVLRGKRNLKNVLRGRLP